MPRTTTKSANCNKAASARAVLGTAFGGRNHVVRTSGFQRTDEVKASESAKVDVRTSDDLKELTGPEPHDVVATCTMSTVAAGEVERHMDEFERATELSKDPSDVFVVSNGKATHLDDDKLPFFFSPCPCPPVGCRARRHGPTSSATPAGCIPSSWSSGPVADQPRCMHQNSTSSCLVFA